MTYLASYPAPKRFGCVRDNWHLIHNVSSDTMSISMKTDYEKRVEALRSLAPPAKPQGYKFDPGYTSTLIASTGMSSSQIAAKLGMAASTVRAFSNGNRKPGAHYAYLVDHALENLVVTHKESPCPSPKASRPARPPQKPK